MTEDRLEEVATEANNKLGEALQRANHVEEIPPSIHTALKKVEEAHHDLGRALPEFSVPEDGDAS